MNINISPIASDKKTIIEVVDENTLKYDGVIVDFSVIPNGGEVEANEPASGIITKDAKGIVTITLQSFYNGSDNTNEDRFPANPYVVSGGILNV